MAEVWRGMLPPQPDESMLPRDWRTGMLPRPQGQSADLLFPQGFQGGLFGVGRPSDAWAAQHNRDARTAYGEVMRRTGSDAKADAAYWKTMLGDPHDNPFVTGFGTADIGALGNIAGMIKAYHGSPHLFKKFQMQRIGSGEGAQAYGHGLYFAESPGVAKSYREALGQRDLKINQLPNFYSKGKAWFAERGIGQSPTGDYTLPMRARLTKMIPPGQKATHAQVMQAVADEGAHIAGIKGPMREIHQRSLDNWVKQYQHHRPKFKNPEEPGALYEVELSPDQHELLDWDVPLAEQSEHVRKMLEGEQFAQASKQYAPAELLDAFLETDYAKKFPSASDVRVAKSIRAENNADDIAEWADKQKRKGGAAENLLGTSKAGSFYQRLVNQLGSQQAASEALRQAGIPGLRYLDRSSRKAGEGTRNFVMFSDEGVKIVKRNDKPMLPMEPSGPMLPTYTREQLERMDIDELDRMAYGVTGGQVIDVDPSKIKIKYTDDLLNPQDKFAKRGMEWANSVDLSEPVKISVAQDGTYHLEDGHHRWFAAQKTGRPLKAEVEVKGKPIEVILGRQGVAKKKGR